MKSANAFCEYIANLVLSGHQAISVTTVEESRCLEDLAYVCENMVSEPGEAPWRLITWDFARGFSCTDADNSSANNPSQALNAIPTELFNSIKGSQCSPSDRDGTITDIHCLGSDYRYYLVIDDVDNAPIVLPPGTGPIVRVGDTVKKNQYLAKPFSQNALFVFKDAALMFNSAEGLNVRRTFRNLVEAQALSHKTLSRPIVFVGAMPVQHPELAESIINVPYALPTPKELMSAVDYIAAGLPANKGEIRPEMRHRMSDALRGFSMAEAKDTAAYISRIKKGFGEGCVEVEEDIIREIHRRKRDKWSTEDSLQLIDSGTLESFEAVGGYNELKSWIGVQKMRFTEKAAALGVRPPKGIVLGGLPGTGKSVVATIIAKELQIPLVEMRVDAVFGSLVGESESRMRSCLAKIKALGPCVVRLDEVDKAMGGMHNSSGGDSGVGSRILGQFLSWQANENKEAFVIMTLNRIKGLPSEMFRTGRFDRVWWVDLPNDEERREIFEIHLKKQGIDPKNYSNTEYASLVETTRGATGSDIEAIVEEAKSFALFQSNAETAVPTYDILISLARESKPLSKTDGGSLEEIRSMFDGRAYPVSTVKSNRTRSSKNQRSVAVAN